MGEKMTKEQLVEFVENMSVLELKELVDMLEDRFGVSAAPVAVAGAAAPVAAAAEEKTDFTVTLKSSGANKINVIKVVRALTGLGLKEAKDLVDGAPKEVKAGVNKEEAQKMKTDLEKEGAVVEVA